MVLGSCVNWLRSQIHVVVLTAQTIPQLHTGSHCTDVFNAIHHKHINPVSAKQTGKGCNTSNSESSISAAVGKQNSFWNISDGAENRGAMTQHSIVTNTVCWYLCWEVDHIDETMQLAILNTSTENVQHNKKLHLSYYSNVYWQKNQTSLFRWIFQVNFLFNSDSSHLTAIPADEIFPLHCWADRSL